MKYVHTQVKLLDSVHLNNWIQAIIILKLNMICTVLIMGAVFEQYNQS